MHGQTISRPTHTHTRTSVARLTGQPQRQKKKKNNLGELRSFRNSTRVKILAAPTNLKIKRVTVRRDARGDSDLQHVPTYKAKQMLAVLSS
ncbi:MAG: hypothetical protein BJ554DRAFT_8396 [Olpidium bornovanus]|uniref:Uncharacterized protein n=1 Tax=Olpidium bornovanus TaxID=278681 RepID=A0A8H7ZUF2_9FUNG|nr:MAG: hypothetical protein BJ554DRAFT_8396 [Olpidium bornovanus]